ncbi:MAG: hypothetical protein C0467_16485 [Planctomycetaceae bacterium]|nr:hypothetical protein [Planctomycetaceae bacterium]
MSTDWQRSVVTLTSTIVTAVVVLVLYFARSVFIPITLSILLAFVLVPVVARLQRRGLGRTPAVLLTLGLVVCGTLGVGTLIAQQFSRLADTLPDRAEAIKGKLIVAKTWISGDSTNRLGHLVDELTGIVAPKPEGQQTVLVERASGSLGSQFDGFIGPATEVLGQAAFAFVLTAYMLLRREDLRNRMIRLLGEGKVSTTTKAVDEASTRISRYLFMQLLVNTGFGAVITLSLFLLGLDYALLWGFIGTLMRYIPYVGTWIGLIPPVMFSFATATGWGEPLAVLVIFLVLEAICNNIFEPWLYGQSMGLSEVAQLVAAAFWAFLWGPMGLILSGPLTTCLLVFGKNVRRFEFLDVLLGDEPPLAPHVAFYQRLAARDQDEAAEVAIKVAKESGPDVAFETVVIPALCMARREVDQGDMDATALRYVIRGVREVATEVSDLRPLASEPYIGSRVRLLVVPARDEAEHAAADIFASTLDHTQWDVRVPGDEMLASELIATVEEFRPTVVVLLALAPGGLSHCRYLVNRLRAKCPTVKVVVGRWGNLDGGQLPSEASEGIKGVEGIGRTFTETQKRLADMAPVLSAQADRATKDEMSSGKQRLVGTQSA